LCHAKKLFCYAQNKDFAPDLGGSNKIRTYVVQFIFAPFWRIWSEKRSDARLIPLRRYHEQSRIFARLAAKNQ
jgi:hypothetical protein